MFQLDWGLVWPYGTGMTAGAAVAGVVAGVVARDVAE